MYRRVLAKPEEWGLLRRVIGVALVAFLLTGALTLPEVWAATYHVATSGNDTVSGGTSAAPWKTLGYALDHVSSGDVIRVAAGTYSSENFPLHLKSGVKIEGAGAGNSFLSAPAKKDVFENVNTPLASNTTLTGFTLEHTASAGTTQTLVHLQADDVAMSPVIDGNEFLSQSPADVGIWVGTYGASSPDMGSFTGTISNNTFSYFDDAIFVSASLSTKKKQSLNANMSPKITGNHLHNNDEGVDAIFNTHTPTGQGIDLTFSPQITDNYNEQGVSGNGNVTDIAIAGGGGDRYGADIEAGNVTAKPLISGNSFTNTEEDSIFVWIDTMSGDTSAVNTISPTITNNTAGNNATMGPGDDGIDVTFGSNHVYGGSAIINATVTGNDIEGASDAGIEVWFPPFFAPQGAKSQVDVNVSNNKVNWTGDDYGVAVSAAPLFLHPTLGNATVTISGNTVSSASEDGILDQWAFPETNTSTLPCYPCKSGSGGANGSLIQSIAGNSVTADYSGDGLEITGATLSSLAKASLDIRDNVLKNNAWEGLDLYYFDWPSRSKVTASCNTVTSNNDDGIYLDNGEISSNGGKTPDLGGGSYGSPGLNTLQRNSNYNLQTGTDLFAENNYWDVSPPSVGSSGSDLWSGGGVVKYSGNMTVPPTTSGTNELAATAVNRWITYTATLAMTGKCGCASTEFTMPFPAHTTFVPGSVVVTNDPGAAVISTADPLVVEVGDLSKILGPVTIRWVMQADASYTGNITAQAQYGCTQLGKTVIMSSNPLTFPNPDPTVIAVPVSILRVPTLDGVGLALLFAFLFLAGLLLLRKKKGGVALMLMVGLMAGLALPARAAPPTFTPWRSRVSSPSARARPSRAGAGGARAKVENVKSAKDRSVLRAVTLTQVAMANRQIHLKLSDGMAITVKRNKVRVLGMKLPKSAMLAMSHRERRRWRRQQARAARSGSALTVGQAMLIRVLYDRKGNIRRVYLRPEASLSSAKADLTSAWRVPSLHSQEQAATQKN